MVYGPEITNIACSRTSNVWTMNTDHHLVTDSARIRRELGYRETVPLDVALARTIAWERQHPPENVDPSQFDYPAEATLWQKFRSQ